MASESVVAYSVQRNKRVPHKKTTFDFGKTNFYYYLLLDSLFRIEKKEIKEKRKETRTLTRTLNIMDAAIHCSY